MEVRNSGLACRRLTDKTIWHVVTTLHADDNIQFH